MSFAALHVATVLDGRPRHCFAQDGEVSVWRDGQTYIYEVPADRVKEFFAWASEVFCADDERLVGTAAKGWRVKGGFTDKGSSQ
jgi:hypothetical protein